MNTCETCTYWSKKRDFQHHDVRRCKYVVMLWDSYEWSVDYGDRCLKDEFKNQKAFVQDGSDYVASLYTKKDFGCNQWSEK